MTATPAEPLRAVAPDDAETGSDSSLSVLGQLKGRREQIIKNNHTDLPVPRWSNPALVVRYGPLEHALFRKANRQVERAADNKKAEVEVQVNSDLLARACVAVYAVIDGKKYSLRPGDPNGEPTRFDDDLAENLGCGHTAREIIKALYITEGDILSTAGSVATFSGYKEQEADDEIAGES
jgi:hypothetical protein